MKFTHCLLCLLLALAGQSTIAQDQQFFQHTIDSKVFGESRTIKIWLPKRYYTDSTIQFSTTIMLDAQSDEVWNLAKGIIDYQVRSYTVVPMIVVGIVSPDRGKEFSPGNTALQEHLRTEVFPLLQENYRINDFKTLIGHSWGGAFVGHTLFGAQKDLFDAYLGISPSLDANNDVIFQAADSILSAKEALGKYFFFSAGDVGFEWEYDRDVRKMDSLLGAHSSRTLQWNSQHYPGLDHFAALAPGITQGLVNMSRMYWVDEKRLEEFAETDSLTMRKQIRDFYAEREKIFGFRYLSKPNSIRYFGDGFRDRGKLNVAVQIYQWGLEQDPDNLRLYIGMADTYDKLVNAPKAKAGFMKIQELLEAQKSQLDADFYQTFTKWSAERLAKYE
ncbi:MAG: alpha/beta hydrolase-fold protein [Bacteroidota bacterium]